jgi:tRNA(Ile)-lysidine synthase
MRLSNFARKLRDEWRRLGLPETGRVVAGVSGGADSLALWLALDELRRAGKLECEIIVAHFNHGLREQSADDAAWVKNICETCGYECVVGAGRVSRRGNLEQRARRARYDFLRRAAEQSDAGFVLTAHTLDDQAETVLLNLMRGSGTDGLSGIKPLRNADCGMRNADSPKTDSRLPPPASRLPPPSSLIPRVARPLVRWARRAETLAVCRARGIEPLTDAMNEDERFARVRVRRELVPLLETFNPRAVEALGRAAELWRADAEVLQEAAANVLNKAEAKASNGVAPLLVKALRDAPAALRWRALRLWLERGRGDLRRLTLTHLRGVERLLEGECGGRVAELPGGARVVRRRNLLIFFAAGQTEVEKGRAEG